MAGTILGRRLKRCPDGELGGRRLWISWQYPLLRGSGYLVASAAESVSGLFPTLVLGPGVKPADIRFSDLGYAHEARASYIDFLAARLRGDLAPGTRFQVCLPTPLAVLVFVEPGDIPLVEPAYHRAMEREVAKICAAIPHQDLCLQWDVCMEMIWYDGQLPAAQQQLFSLTDFGERIARLSAGIPADVELGVHLCYGDLDGKHFVEPKDATKMVEFGNALMATLPHPLTYIHMPVPIQRDDDAFFVPFDDLRLTPGTQLFLGMVHVADGVEGLGRRMAAADRHVASYGIATECGMARARTPEITARLLRIHAEGTVEPS